MLASSVGFQLNNFISLIAKKLHGTSFGAFLERWESIIFSIIIALIVVVIFRIGACRKERVPKGLQNVLELYVESIRQLANTVIGPKGDPYVPFLGTLFIYLLAMNLFGLFPLMKSPTGNLNVTLAFAICVFVLVQYLNIKHMGIGGFLYHMAGSPKHWTAWLMVPLMFPIELLTHLSRPITLAFRLFGNILGEKVLIAYFTLLGISLIPFISPIGVPLQVPFLLFGVFTGVLQAMVFTLLATIYILLTISEEEH